MSLLPASSSNGNVSRSGGGFALATNPACEPAARRLLAKPRTPPLTQAQAECLGIVAYVQPVSRPEVARIRGVSSESAISMLIERGLIEEGGRSRFGAVLYRTTDLFERLFGLEAIEHTLDHGTDLEAIDEGYVSVTPLQLDLTHHASLGAMAERYA